MLKRLYKKELTYYLNNAVGYIVIVLFAVFANFLFVKDIFVVGEASMRPFFGIVPWLLIIFVPALCMRMFAEERRQNTLELLLSLPVSEIQILLAKFFAVLTLIAIALVLTLGLPVSLSILSSSAGSSVYFPEIITGYVGVIFMSAMFTAVSLFLSLKTHNQIVAFLSYVLVLFFLIIFSTDFVAGFLPRVVQTGLNYVSPVTQLDGFIKGVVDLRSFFYFVSVTTIMLFLSVIELERRS
ncbi:ABC transporter permease subunit [Candidatus Woesebacteria bacterium]|nr:ABC transporter permease subunit [Candidatus Woesebacteria bacterium]